MAKIRVASVCAIHVLIEEDDAAEAAVAAGGADPDVVAPQPAAES